jgi:uncharacterized protein (DUF486 family)
MPKVILLLIGSNIFMTIAWYGHLKLVAGGTPAHRRHTRRLGRRLL